MLSDNKLKLAIQKKGRLTSDSLSLLRSCKFDFRVNEHLLFSICNNFPLEVLYLRDDDIPDIVLMGAADLGIVHDILLHERKEKFNKLLQLGFGDCSLVIAVPKQSKIRYLTDLRDSRNLRIATSYPYSTKAFFDKHHIHVEVIEMSGSIEIFPRLGVVDAIVDIMSTGSSLYWHDLRVIDKIYCNLSTFLIASHEAMMSSKKRRLINNILERFHEVIERSKNRNK